MSVFTAVLPVVTLVLGYFGTLVTEGFRDRRATERAAAERREQIERDDARRRDGSELWILDRAYSQLGDVGRAAGRVHVFDMRESKSDQYMPTQLPPAMNETMFVANQRARRTAAILLDDVIRQAYLNALDLVGKPSIMFRANAAAADAAMVDAMQAVEHAFDLLGSRIRELLRAGVIMPEVSPGYHEPLVGPAGVLLTLESRGSE